MSKQPEHQRYLKLRTVAGLIDYSIQIVFFMGWISYFGTKGPNGEGGYGYSLVGTLALAPFFFWAFMVPGMEQWWGATLGNSLVGLKPVSIKRRDVETELSTGQSIKRHLLDPVDMAFMGIVAIILIDNTKHKQRLGDLWAGTKVVVEKETMIGAWL